MLIKSKEASAIYSIKRFIIDIMHPVQNKILKFRIRKWSTRLFVPLNTPNHYRIEINITFDCNLKCLNCNRSSRQAPSNDFMSLQQIEKFIKESRYKGRKWRSIALMGGEPTLHPQIFEIVNMLLAYTKECGGNTEIKLVTNGLGEKVKDVISRMPKDIHVYNTNKTSNVQEKFYSFNVAPIDLKEFNNADYSNKCRITKDCGLALNKYGYYLTSNGSGIDRVFGFDIGRKELPDVNDEMLDQALILCKYCGRFKMDYGLDYYYAKGEEMSPSWVEAYERYKKQKPVLREY